MAGKSPSLRRIQADIRELRMDPSERYVAEPLEDDMFEWHFTIRGADGTDFEGGVYHGRILLPPDYPFKPPNIVFLTPSGRFEVGTKVCLSFSAHHPELWQPAWGIRLILEALISFLPTPADGAIGALDWTTEERKRLAKKSTDFCCARCGNCALLLPKITDKKASSASSNRFQKEIEKLKQMQSFHHVKEDEKDKAEDKNKVKENDSEEETSGEVVKETDDTKEDMVAKQSDSENNKDNSALVEEKKDGDNAEEEGIDNAMEKEAETPAPTSTAPVGTDVNVAMAPVSTSTTTEPLASTAPLPPLFSDPVIHAAIILFAIAIGMLFQKFIALVDEIQSLEY